MLLVLPIIDTIGIVVTEREAYRISVFTIFLVFAFFINVYVIMRFSRRFIQSQDITQARKLYDGFRKRLNSSQAKVDRIGKKMQKKVLKIRKLAYKFREHWDQIQGEKPSIALPPTYVFVLNNKIWHEQVLPHGELNYQVPPRGELSAYSDFWTAATESPMNYPRKIGASQKVTERQKKANARADERVAAFAGKASKQAVNNKRESTSELEDTSEHGESFEASINNPEEESSFGTVISDNEKFV